MRIFLFSPNTKAPTKAANGKIKSVVQLFVAKAPAIAERRLIRKIDDNTMLAVTPGPGSTPTKIPIAAPAAIL